MTMDVYGVNPTSESGRYFQTTSARWSVLWRYCCDVAPGLDKVVPSGFTNDGDGLDAGGAMKLADLLTIELDAGRTARLEAEYMAAREFYLATHARQKPRWWRRRRPGYVPGFSAEEVADFRDFVAASGGFEIL